MNISGASQDAKTIDPSSAVNTTSNTIQVTDMDL